MKKDSYIVIQAWMVEKLQLSGTQLLIYAIIYGFSQDGESWFRGNQEYLAKWCGCTVRSVRTATQELVDRKLVERKKVEGQNRYEYRCNEKAFSATQDEEKISACHKNKGENSSNKEENYSKVSGNNFQSKGKIFPKVEENFSANNLVYNINNNIVDNIRDNNSTEPEKSGSVLVAALVLNDKSLYGVSALQVAEWEELYPSVDVMQEIRNMCGWLEGNPTKRKTRNGVLRFIHAWLSKVQNKGGNKPQPTAIEQKRTYDLAAWEYMDFTREKPQQ